MSSSSLQPPPEPHSLDQDSALEIYSSLEARPSSIEAPINESMRKSLMPGRSMSQGALHLPEPLVTSEIMITIPSSAGEETRQGYEHTPPEGPLISEIVWKWLAPDVVADAVEVHALRARLTQHGMSTASVDHCVGRCTEFISRKEIEDLFKNSYLKDSLPLLFVSQGFSAAEDVHVRDFGLIAAQNSIVQQLRGSRVSGKRAILLWSELNDLYLEERALEEHMTRHQGTLLRFSKSRDKGVSKSEIIAEERAFCATLARLKPVRFRISAIEEALAHIYSTPGARGFHVSSSGILTRLDDAPTEDEKKMIQSVVDGIKSRLIGEASFEEVDEDAPRQDLGPTVNPLKQSRKGGRVAKG